ncbi:MAG: hypothetical protein NC925_01240 [Candidatus Omnitrophica bacterium]|nr:hypothetical protein [Candidatus Omnitrophota bacterium]
MQRWKNFKNIVWECLVTNIKSYHFIIVGLILIIFGVYSILKIKNSEWYSGRTVVFGVFLFVSGIYIFIGEIKNRRH